MGALTRLLAGVLLAASPARADELDRWQPLIEQASARFGIPSNWIRQVMRAESAGHTALDEHPIRSRAGAIGLMQLMPGTWSEMRARLALGDDPDDPRDNIFAGSFFLRLMYDRFGFPGLFGAYNAGPGRYALHLATRQALPPETVAYLTKVSGAVPVVSDASDTTRPDNLFVVRTEPSEGGADHPKPALFAVKHDVP